jgi:hypothetical protein
MWGWSFYTLKARLKVSFTASAFFSYVKAMQYIPYSLCHLCVHTVSTFNLEQLLRVTYVHCARMYMAVNTFNERECPQIVNGQAMLIHKLLRSYRNAVAPNGIILCCVAYIYIFHYQLFIFIIYLKKNDWLPWFSSHIVPRQ